jgi:hypothetical protein
MNQNPAIVAIVAIVALGVALFVLVFVVGGSTASYENRQYFYDTESQTLFTASALDYPDVSGSSGNPENAVFAYVYSCDACGDYDGMTSEEVEAAGGFIAFISTLTPQAKAALAARTDRDSLPEDNLVQQGLLAKRLGDNQWMSWAQFSDRVYGEEMSRRCGGAEAQRCWPQ